jgi:photosystem II stability/assembly factor-like uncharacterized protein
MKRLACLAIAVFVAALASAEPRWQPVGPQAGPPSARLFFGPGGGTYALTPAGLWRASAGGAWSSVQIDGLGSPFLAFAADPATPGRAYGSIQGLDGFSSIVRTDDRGNSWRTVSQILGTSTNFPEALQVDPFTPGTLYRMANTGLDRSLDGGRTWDCVPFAGYCNGARVDSFALAPDRPGTLYVSARGEFYRTADGGRTWSHSPQETPMDSLVATRAPRTLYGWTEEDAFRGNLVPCLMRSDDEGRTWKELLRPPHKCGAPGIDPSDPRTVRIAILADGEPRLWVSRDGGGHWREAGALPGVGDLFVTPSKELILSTPDGLYRAPGENGPWQPANRGFTSLEVRAFIAVEETFLASPVNQTYNWTTPIAALRTGNGGRTWSPAPLRNALAFAADPSDPLHLIASAERYESLSVVHWRVLESRDGGRSWRGVVDPAIDPPPFQSLAIDPEDSRTLYGGSQFEGFYRSQDGGRTWAAANSGLPYEVHCTPYYCDTNSASTILPREETGTVAIVFEMQVFVSRDQGSSWRQASPYVTPLGNVEALARDPEGNLVAVAGGKNPHDADSLGVVYRSTDEGVTWTRLGLLPPKFANYRSSYVSSVAATREGIFVGTNLLGVLFSANGAAWSPLNAGLPRTSVISLVTDPSDPASVYATVPRAGVYVLRGR